MFLREDGFYDPEETRFEVMYLPHLSPRTPYIEGRVRGCDKLASDFVTIAF